MRRRTLKRWITLPSHRERTLEEVRQELENHLQESIEYFVQRGMSVDDARAEAMLRLGSLEDAHRTLYRVAQRRENRLTMRHWITSLLEDSRYTLRSLGRRPAFAALVMATLALGIGANVAMFGIVDRMLLQGPARIQRADRVKRVYLTAKPPAMAMRTFSYTSLLMEKSLRESGAFASVAAYGSDQFRLGRGESAETVNGASTSGSFFEVLGVNPELGRFYEDRDVDISREPSGVVISHALWQRHLGGAADAIGKPITLNDTPYRIVGIAPAGFTGPAFSPVDIWMPLRPTFAPFAGWASSWDGQVIQVIARLPDGTTDFHARDRAQAAYNAAYSRADWQRGGRIELLPLRFDPEGKEPREVTVSRWLFAVSVIVLLAAFANVANLLLSRGVSRQREIAVRLALGIQRWRLMRLLLAETMILAIGGAVMGWVTGVWAAGLIRHSLFVETADASFAADSRLVGFATIATVITGLALGLTSAARSNPSSVTASLKEGSPSGSRSRQRIGMTLTAVQAAVSVVLLAGSGLFLLSLARVRRVDLGMHPERVVYASIRWPSSRDLPPDQRAAVTARRQAVRAQALSAIRALPTVRFATISSAIPFRSTGIEQLRVPGRDTLPRLPGGGPFVNTVGANYFATLGTSVVAGRDFTPDDGRISPVPIVLSETTARLLWGGEAAVGKCVVVGEATNPCSPVIGVVRDSRRFALREEMALQVFKPANESAATGFLMAQVGDQDLAAFQRELRHQLAALDQSIAYVEVGSLQEAINPKLRPWQLGASMFSVFGALALVIAVLGLYSVVSYATANRTHEIGVRIALGARIADIIGMVLASGLRAVFAGVALGIGVAIAASSRLQPLLYETSARSPAVYAAVSLVLFVAGIVACIIPGRRAARVDPIAALRAD